MRSGGVKRRGSRSKLSQATVRLIKRMASEDGVSSKKIIVTLNLPVSISPVQRALRSEGSLIYKKMKKVPYISQKNERKRLECLLQMQVEEEKWWDEVLSRM